MEKMLRGLLVSSFILCSYLPIYGQADISMQLMNIQKAEHPALLIESISPYTESVVPIRWQYFDREFKANPCISCFTIEIKCPLKTQRLAKQLASYKFNKNTSYKGYVDVRYKFTFSENDKPFLVFYTDDIGTVVYQGRVWQAQDIYWFSKFWKLLTKSFFIVPKFKEP